MADSPRLMKFFITHSFKDNGFATRLANDLRKQGLEGFFDMYSIKPGDNLVQRIDQGLRECENYVPVLSAAALKSPWCQEEISAAINLSNDPSRRGRPKIISLLLENCQEEMPVFLRTRLYLNVAEDYEGALQKLLDNSLKIESNLAEQKASDNTELRLATHFIVKGWTYAGNTFPPGSEEYQAYQLNWMLNKTYVIWREFFGTDILWHDGLPHLAVDPRAGQDFNAYYDRADRASLKFFYETDRVTQQPIYTCEDRDIIAHTAAHAILDAYRPDDWDSLLSETAAFTEAFSDISSMLVSLDDPQVRQEIFTETGGDLRKSNPATRLSKDLARGIYNAGYNTAVVSVDALRDAANNFKYRNPNELPRNAPASKLSSESHSFSRVFTGAFYDLLVNLYEQLRKEDKTLSADAALERARYDAGRLIAQGLLLAPVGDLPFSSAAASMLSANELVFAGKYSTALRKAFVGRRILTTQQVNKAHTVVPKLPKVFKQTPTEIRVGKRTLRLVSENAHGDTGRVLSYSDLHEWKLKGAGLGVAQGAIATLTDSLTLRLDQESRVISAHMVLTDRAQEKRFLNFVRGLVKDNTIYAMRRGEKLDFAALRDKKKFWYVETDAKGRKRLNAVPKHG